MIQQIILWSVNNRILILLLSVMLALAGVYAVKQTPVDAIPDLSDVQVIVKTSQMPLRHYLQSANRECLRRRWTLQEVGAGSTRLAAAPV